ncbi:hypothetical protein [Dyadobacter sp. CY323]|uniref:hypothetical protein n=1 Tax=Dyadobacter sp. CY323 TaxID=2907302 RepID=UPI001F2EAA5F|nr:hypothetical protein [Dyadobacter sp. CY323]MCE6991330.1 hypothetical protein [Dyadobacter sp. CY323]
MSKKQIFSIHSLNAEGDKFVAEVSLDATNAIYKGHFPNLPVTPGVIQLQMVKKVAEQHLQRDLKVKTIRSCKFLEVLNPEKTPRFIIEFVIKENEVIEVNAMGRWGESTFFKAQVTYI